jgi:pyruvate dehydrogenase E1 component alpha subunit
MRRSTTYPSVRFFRTTSKVISVEDVADRGAAYGIPGVVVDAQNVMAVYEATHAAVTRAREGDGPSLLECKTYRFMGHMGGAEPDRDTYRTRQELEEWQRRDPISSLEATLVKMDALTSEEAKGIEAEIMAKLDEAVAFAEESPLPAPEEALDDLFA